MFSVLNIRLCIYNFGALYIKILDPMLFTILSVWMDQSHNNMCYVPTFIINYHKNLIVRYELYMCVSDKGH
jgi:hypothetical protein